MTVEREASPGPRGGVSLVETVYALAVIIGSGRSNDLKSGLKYEVSASRQVRGR